MAPSEEEIDAFVTRMNAMMEEMSPENLLARQVGQGDHLDQFACSDEGADSVREEDEDDTEGLDDDPFIGIYAKSNSQVCVYCEDFFMTIIEKGQDHEWYADIEHFGTFWDMRTSSRTCGLCWLFMLLTDQYLTHGHDVAPYDRTMKLDCYQIRGPSYPNVFCDKEMMASSGIYEFTLDLGYCDDDPRFNFLVMTDSAEQGSISQRAIWSDQTPLQLGSRLPVLKEWLGSCRSEHKKCRQKMEQQIRLPTRLIDLFESRHTGSFHPKLILTDQLEQSDIKYTTLSHRWGDKQPVQTFRDNIDESFKAIFVQNNHKIPKTFNDAFKITRSLGLRYIWIDSICIVQDDAEDWQREALRMADVYQGSFLNIAAVDSPNCYGGCSLDLGWSTMTLTGPRMGGHVVKVRTALPANPSDVYASHLNTRGWVFQELTLAPRVLYCGRSQFYWQCTEKVYSEDGYIDHDVALNIPGDRDLLERTQEWTSWASDSSQRSFTEPTDRLPSLAGVIQRYQNETGHAFILGMWQETLIDDLAWRTREVEFNRAHAFPTERSSLNNIPSWSWLSLHVDKYKGGVMYFPLIDDDTRVISAKIEAADVVWKAEPLVSEIVSTSLIIRGPLQVLSLTYDHVRRRLYGQEGEESRETETYVIRLDEKYSDKEYGKKRDYWCLELEHADVENERISTFLVLEEVEDKRKSKNKKTREDDTNTKTDESRNAQSNEGNELRVFRRLGCGRIETASIKFDNPVEEVIELV